LIFSISCSETMPEAYTADFQRVNTFVPVLEN